MANRRFNKQTTNSRTPMKVGGRAMKMGGGQCLLLEKIWLQDTTKTIWV